MEDVRRVLITGAGGGVGHFLIDALRADYDIVAFDLVPPRDETVAFIQGDVTDRDAVFAASTGVDVIVHLAAVLRMRDGADGLPYVTDPQEHDRVNLGGTRHVLESAAANHVGRVVFAGSDSAYGFVFAEESFQPRQLPIDEEHPLQAMDPYGRSKAAGEDECRVFSAEHDLSIIALRCCLIAFPDFYDGLDRTRALGFLNHKRNWGYVDVRDVCSAYRLAIEAEMSGFQTYLISAHDTYADHPTHDLLTNEYSDVPLSAGFPATPYASLFTTARAERELGFQPRFSCRSAPTG